MAGPVRFPQRLRDVLGPEAAEDMVNLIEELRVDREAADRSHAELLAAIRQVGGRIQAVELRLDDVRTELVDRGENVRTTLAASIEQVRSSLTAQIEEVRTSLAGRIDEVDTRLTRRIDDVDTSLTERIEDVRVSLTERHGETRVEIARATADLMKWSFVFWVGAVAAIALLAGVLRS